MGIGMGGYLYRAIDFLSSRGLPLPTAKASRGPLQSLGRRTNAPPRKG